jgi:hypothetical protein
MESDLAFWGTVLGTFDICTLRSVRRESPAAALGSFIFAATSRRSRSAGGGSSIGGGGSGRGTGIGGGGSVMGSGSFGGGTSGGMTGGGFGVTCARRRFISASIREESPAFPARFRRGSGANPHQAPLLRIRRARLRAPPALRYPGDANLTRAKR